MKINFDGAMFSESDEAGLGVVIQNSKGEVLVALFEKIQKPTVTPQTRKGLKYEKNVSKVPIDFVPSDKSIQIKSYQLPTSRIIIILPLNILSK